VAMAFIPRYIDAKLDGILEERIEELESKLNACVLCPRQCKANRMVGDLGYCAASYELNISSAFQHFGEEAPLVGRHGSGTIFLTHCNLKCCFCQNYEISIYGDGLPYSYGKLARVMVDLQERGCHNINLVTPTHYVPQIIKALSIAIDLGLKVPLVYNCGGYESIEVIRLLDGIIDIYMPDMKFLNRALAARFCRAEDYPEVAAGVIKEMQRQVGDLIIEGDGTARRGLLIRHLVMPSCGEDTRDILRFIRAEVSKDAFVNIMAQYHPCYKAAEYREIANRTQLGEYYEAVEYARAIGLTRASAH
jgi:putative pyruvate formate lyase activating enzyme